MDFGFAAFRSVESLMIGSGGAAVRLVGVGNRICGAAVGTGAGAAVVLSSASSISGRGGGYGSLEPGTGMEWTLHYTTRRYKAIRY